MAQEKNSDDASVKLSDLHKIGTVAHGDASPRTATFGSAIAKVVGIAAAFFSAEIVRDAVSEAGKEDLTPYKYVKGDGILGAMQKSIKQAVDFKLWKSNLSSLAVFAGGMALTNMAVKKIEQRAFTSRHGDFSGHMGRVNEILENEFSNHHQKKTSWQDKTKNTEESHQGHAR